MSKKCLRNKFPQPVTFVPQNTNKRFVASADIEILWSLSSPSPHIYIVVVITSGSEKENRRANPLPLTESLALNRWHNFNANIARSSRTWLRQCSLDEATSSRCDVEKEKKKSSFSFTNANLLNKSHRSALSACMQIGLMPKKKEVITFNTLAWSASRRNQIPYITLESYVAPATTTRRPLERIAFKRENENETRNLRESGHRKWINDEIFFFTRIIRAH